MSPLILLLMVFVGTVVALWLAAIICRVEDVKLGRCLGAVVGANLVSAMVGRAFQQTGIEYLALGAALLTVAFMYKLMLKTGFFRACWACLIQVVLVIVMVVGGGAALMRSGYITPKQVEKWERSGNLVQGMLYDAVGIDPPEEKKDGSPPGES